jgi:tetratricopeptide (TPR) repeat protein
MTVINCVPDSARQETIATAVEAGLIDDRATVNGVLGYLLGKGEFTRAAEISFKFDGIDCALGIVETHMGILAAADFAQNHGYKRCANKLRKEQKRQAERKREFDECQKMLNVYGDENMVMAAKWFARHNFQDRAEQLWHMLTRLSGDAAYVYMAKAEAHFALGNPEDALFPLELACMAYDQEYHQMKNSAYGRNSYGSPVINRKQVEGMINVLNKASEAAILAGNLRRAIIYQGRIVSWRKEMIYDKKDMILHAAYTQLQVLYGALGFRKEALVYRRKAFEARPKPKKFGQGNQR